MDLVEELRRAGDGAMATPGRSAQDAKPPTLEAERETENAATNPIIVKTGEHSASHEILADNSQSQQPEEEEHEEAGEEKDLSESNPLMIVSTPRGGHQSVPGFSSPPSFGNEEKATCKNDYQEAQETQAPIAEDEHAPFLDSSHSSPVEGAECDDKLNIDNAITRATEQTAGNDALQDVEGMESDSEEIEQPNGTSMAEYQTRGPQEVEDADDGVDPGISAHADKLYADDADTEVRGEAEDSAGLRNLELLEHSTSHVDVSSEDPQNEFERPDETQPAQNLALELEKFEGLDSDDNSRISANGDNLDADCSTTQSPEQAGVIATLQDFDTFQHETSHADLSFKDSHKEIVQPGEIALSEHEAREHQVLDDAMTEADQETNALAAQHCEEIFNNHKPKAVRIYVWVQFLAWLLRLNAQHAPPGSLEMTACLYGVKILGWLTGVDSAWVIDYDWPTESGDSSFSSSDDNPKPPKPLPPLVGARAIFLYPLACNHELYQRRLIYYHMWVQRKNPNFAHADTRTSPAEMYAGIRDACYIYLVTVVGSFFSVVALFFGCWMVIGMFKNAGWFRSSSLEFQTESHTSGIYAQFENIRPTGIADGTSPWSAVSQALDFAAMAASMNFSAAYTPYILLTRQRASRSMFEFMILTPWASTDTAHLAVLEAPVSGDDVMNDIYSRIDLARDVIGPFQRGLLGLDSLVLAGANDWVASGHVATGLYGAREAENIILGGIPETTLSM